MADNSRLVAAALEKTDSELHDSIDGTNSWKDGILKRGARIKKYRAYERGDHDANLTDQMKKMLRLDKANDDADLEEFNDNYTKLIVDKMAGRVSISEISTKDEKAQEWINEVLIENDFDSLGGELFRGAIRDGDAFVIIDPVTLGWASEPAYDGFSGVVAVSMILRKSRSGPAKFGARQTTQV